MALRAAFLRNLGSGALSIHPSPKLLLPAQQLGHPWPACALWQRLCMWTLRRLQWTRLPIRELKIVICLAVKPSFLWSSEPKAAPAAPSPRTIHKVLNRCGRISQGFMLSCLPLLMMLKGCSRLPSAIITPLCLSNIRCSIRLKVASLRRTTSSLSA